MMSDYYKSNSVYEYLSRCDNKENFFWVSGNMWLILYGNQESEPKVLTVVSEMDISKELCEGEIVAVKTAKKLVEGTNVMCNFIRFQPKKKIENVIYWEEGDSRLSNISSDNLKKRLEAYGLKINSLRAKKDINSKSSSPYHEWQRENMGAEIVASDIDLIRMTNSEPIELIELKRSKIPIEKWQPYQEDYRNFLLLSRLANYRKLQFYIVYNHRQKVPVFIDDIQILKVFEFNKTQDYCRLLGYMSIENFTHKEKTEVEE